MRKMRLDLDALAVETFDTKGGVGGMESGFELYPSAESGCGPCPTKEATCFGTCPADNTCKRTCNVYCDPTV